MYLTRSAGGLVLLIFALVAFATVETMAFPTGPPANSAKEGCTCHGAASTETAVRLTGVPAEYTAEARYPLSVISQSPVALLDPPENYGGFQLMASRGHFLNVSSFNATWIEISADGKTAQHTEAGDKSNEPQRWDLIWVAPTPARESTTFYLAVNRVNGDGTVSGDLWNKVTLTSLPLTEKKGAPGPEAGLLVAVVTAAALLGRSRRTNS